jgi:RND family efflux transporter MFP subunit
MTAIRPAAAALAVVLVAGACRREAAPTRAPTPVRVQPVGTESTSAGLGYSASIEPYAQVALDWKVGGYVEAILRVRGADGRMRDVQDGDPIAKGTVLARIDDRQYRDQVRAAAGQLAEARAKLVQSRAQWQRSSALWKTQSITAPDYDRARKDFDAAQGQVAAAEAQLAADELDVGWAQIVAPSDGVLLQRSIDVGSLASPGTVAFQLADTSRVKAVFSVPDVALGSVHVGAPQTVVSDAFPGTEFAGRVTEVSAAADTQTRVFSVEVTIPNADGRLRPGMVASLQVAAGPTAAVPVVPLSAVVRDPGPPGGYAVYVAATGDDGTRARIRPVDLGKVYGDVVAVPKGLEAGDRVIVRGATLVRDGAPVSVVP